MNFPAYTHNRNSPNFYRGWYDPFQKMISVVLPRFGGQVDPALGPSSLPTRLRVSLNDSFGTNNQIVVF